MVAEPCLPTVEIITPSRFFEKTRYRFVSDYKVGNTVIPAGFVTDGASTPRLLWWLFPPVGRYFVAAAYHDYLIRYDLVTRTEADKLFYQCLKTLDVPRWASWCLYQGVKIGTFFARFGVDLSGNGNLKR